MSHEKHTALLLHIADDPSLLSTRGLILESYWNVVNSGPRNAWKIFSENDFDLVVICHSVSLSCRQWIVKRISDISPSIPILIVSSNNSLFPTPPAIITAQEPDTLVAMIGEYLRQHPRLQY